MWTSRGQVLLLIYSAVLLALAVWAEDGTQVQTGASQAQERRGSPVVEAPPEGRRGDQRSSARSRRREERRQRHKDQAQASSSLHEAIESHHKYSSASNTAPAQKQEPYPNQTSIVQPYHVNHQYDHPKPGQ